jgi:1-acyl-sn-glycerol-3-phosphate acyltransferase
MGYKFVRFVVTVIVNLLARVEVVGIENLPRQGCCIVTPNHFGRLEVLLVYYLLERSDIILLIAEKYRQSAFWSWFAKRVNGIFIDRYNADFSALREVLRRLNAGGILVIAPEGTRSKSGKLQEGLQGAAYIAAKSGAPVVPVGATGTWDEEVYSNIRHLRKSNVTVRIGKLFTLPPLKGPHREEQLEQDTEEIMCQIAALLPPELRGAYTDHPRLVEILEQQTEQA